MYQRIVLKDSDIKEITDGKLLPSVLNISSQIGNKVNKTKPKLMNSRYYSDDDPVLRSVGLTQNLLYGTIGDNKYEFGIDFYILNFLDLTDETKSLNDKLNDIEDFYEKYYNHEKNSKLNTLKWIKWIYNDQYINIDSSILLNDFYVFELNDYSYQAMTANNYDYDVKVFFSKQDSLGNYYKLPQTTLTVLKSYTYKKAWVLIDKSIVKEKYNITKIIIDFKYKFNNFENINKEWNISGLFNPIDNSSPYHDQMLFSKTGNYHILNKQDDYFNKFYNTAEDNDKYKSPEIIEKLIINDENVIDKNIDKFKCKIFNYTLNDTVYENNVSYEIYEYDKNNIMDGKRVLQTTNTKIYEVFPVPSNFIHYIFKYTLADPESLTITQLQEAMKKKKYYLYNYAIKNINTFKIQEENFVEVYIPIPYTDTVNYVNVNDNASALDIEIPSNLKFQGSFYDPENLDSKGLKSEGLLLPYYYNDNFVPKNEGSAYIIDVNKQTANPHNVLEYRNSNVLDFDIRAYTNKELNNENTIIDDKILDIREKNKFNFENNIDIQLNIICQNLYNLITWNEPNIDTKINTDIPINDCLFIYCPQFFSTIKILKTYNNNDSHICYLNAINDIIIIPSENDLKSIRILDIMDNEIDEIQLKKVY